MNALQELAQGTIIMDNFRELPKLSSEHLNEIHHLIDCIQSDFVSESEYGDFTGTQQAVRLLEQHLRPFNRLEPNARLASFEFLDKMDEIRQLLIDFENGQIPWNLESISSDLKWSNLM